MAKKLRSEDIIEKGLFKEEIENTKKLLKIVMALKDEFKELGESVKKSVAETSKIKGSEEVKKYTEETEKLNKATEDLTALEKEEIKLKKKLVDLNEEQAKENAKLRVQVQQKNKELKEEAKINLGLESTYQKQSKRLNELRKKYKNLVLEQGKNTKGAKELREEIQELDKTLKDVDADVGQFQRSVGNYEKINEGAKRSFNSLSGFLLGTLVGSFERSRESGRLVTLTIERLKNVVGIVAIAIKDTVMNFIVPSFSLLIEKGRQLSQAFELVTDPSKAFSSDFQERVVKTSEKIKELQTELENSENPWKGILDLIGESDDALVSLLEAQDRFIDTQSRLRIEIAKLTAEEENLRAISDDATKSFKERENNLTKSVEKLKERIKKEEELAKIQRDIAIQQVELDFKNNEQQEKFAQIRTQLQNNDLSFLKDKEMADIVQLDNLNALVDATENFIDVKAQGQLAEKEADKELSQLQQDRLERDLDILIDGFDNQKTINERKLQDERIFLSERQKLLDKTIQLANQSFEEQKDVLEDLSKAGVDIDELMGLDATKLQQRIRDLEQSEIIEGRTLEVVRERRTVLQDLEDAQRDLNEALDEQFLKERELTALKEGKTGQELENEIIKAQIDLLKKQIKERELAGQETIDQEIELARLEIDIEKRKQDEIRELVQETTAFIEEEFGRRTDLIIEDIDRQIDASKNRESQLIDSANAGNRLADESVALERERQAQLEADRKKALQRQQRIELILASINAYSNRSRSGDENALLNTISDITTLLTFASNVQAFEQGGLVEGGEQLVRINEKGQEFVLRHDVVQKVGVDKLNRLNQGDINALNDRSGDLVATEYMIKQAMKGVASEVANAVKQIPVQNWNMSEITGGLKESIQEGKKIVNKHYKKQKRLS